MPAPILTSVPVVKARRILRDPRYLPKAHLHLHLEGSARASTVRELAEREGIRLPALTKTRFEGFADFGAALSAATRVIKGPEDLARVRRELGSV